MGKGSLIVGFTLGTLIVYPALMLDRRIRDQSENEQIEFETLADGKECRAYLPPKASRGGDDAPRFFLSTSSGLDIAIDVEVGAGHADLMMVVEDVRRPFNRIVGDSIVDIVKDSAWIELNEKVPIHLTAISSKGVHVTSAYDDLNLVEVINSMEEGCHLYVEGFSIKKTEERVLDEQSLALTPSEIRTLNWIIAGELDRELSVDNVKATFDKQARSNIFKVSRIHDLVPSNYVSPTFMQKLRDLSAFRILPKFENVTNFYSDAAAAKQGNLWGLIDTDGNWILAPEFSEHWQLSRWLLGGETRQQVGHFGSQRSGDASLRVRFYRRV